MNQVVQYSTSFFLSASIILVLLLCGFLFVECIAALFPVRVVKQTSNSNTRVTVMIPAHNEERAIARTLKQVNLAAVPQQEVLVIADNCDDGTAKVARMHGATTIERSDRYRHGKGYALDFGIQFIKQNPPDVLVVVDADCDVEPQTIQLLTQTAIATGKPTQASYLMNKPQKPTPRDAISAFAFKVKNLARSRGLVNLGLPCILSGTGMAFPWSVIRNMNLANGHIVEDMKLSLDLNLAGYGTVFCPEARVLGTLPQNQNNATTQRTRWEHGHLITLRTYVPVLLGGALSQGRWDLFWSAVDLSIPPLSLLVMLWFAVTLISLLFSFLAGLWLPSLVVIMAGVLLLSAILIAWCRFGKDELPLQQLLSVPLYLIWKIPLYFRFLIKPERNWIRTERDY